MTEYLQNATVRLAMAMDRRRFIRRAAGATFAGVASLAAGRLINPTSAFAYTQTCEAPSGPGCPYGCGQSRCCYTQSDGCLCGDGSGGCKNDGNHCHGKVGDWSGASCWTCTHDVCHKPCNYRYTTTCCDCRTSGCALDSDNICIAFVTTSTVIGGCGGGSCSLPGGTVVGVATGDPKTSWGMQPELAPLK